MNEQVAKKLGAFFSQFKHQQYKKGEILVRADDDPQGVFYPPSQKTMTLVVNECERSYGGCRLG